MRLSFQHIIGTVTRNHGETLGEATQRKNHHGSLCKSAQMLPESLVADIFELEAKGF